MCSIKTYRGRSLLYNFYFTLTTATLILVFKLASAYWFGYGIAWVWFVEFWQFPYNKKSILATLYEKVHDINQEFYDFEEKFLPQLPMHINTCVVFCSFSEYTPLTWLAVTFLHRNYSLIKRVTCWQKTQSPMDIVAYFKDLSFCYGCYSKLI